MALLLAGFALLPANAQDTALSVSNTSWSGRDMFGGRSDYYFGPDGMLIARDGRGVITGTASWRQNDAVVDMEFNAGFIELTGTRTADQLAGTGRTKAGRSGDWALTRQEKNFDSLVQLYESRKAMPSPDQPNPAALTGRYEATLTENSSTYAFRLVCGSDQTCEIGSKLTRAGNTLPQPLPFPSRYQPVKRMDVYQNALNFARNNRFENTNKANSLYQLLSPVLQGDTLLDRCFDTAEHHQPTAAVCATKRSPDGRPFWVYFVPLMTCNREFCAYMPVPLYPAKD